jgi:hypothetical protein
VNRISHFLFPLAFALAFALPPLLVGGVGIGRAMLASLAKAPSLSTTLPARLTYDPSKPVAVVVAGNGRTRPWPRQASSTSTWRRPSVDGVHVAQPRRSFAGADLAEPDPGRQQLKVRHHARHPIIPMQTRQHLQPGRWRGVWASASRSAPPGRSTRCISLRASSRRPNLALVGTRRGPGRA